ncbi:LysR family transcriptional regulator [Litoribrevibacter euphylliae]|uniref:LysR family transcriptional regulator n=1 Tax=Litoribrevibacter euphylliae TaxID=1834034 RepID=A0ABV7HJV9_9GAMM
MRYTFRQLEVFLAAAHFQNITKAADSLSMSQSAASSALKDIESQFDLPLFDRIGKRLQLNEQGRLIRPKAEQLIEQAKELERIMAQHKDAGHLKVGATLTIGNYLAVSTMAEMMQEQPDAEVSLSVANTSEIGQKVLNFEIDIGLIEGELQHQDLDVIPWREDELVVFCSPDHPFADQLQLNDRQLKDAEWILREGGSGTRQAFDRAMHGVLPEIQVKLELQHTEAIKRAVSANLGIGCLSRVALEDAFKRGSLIPLPVPHRDFSRKFYFVIHKQKYRSAGIERWMELCRSSS